MEKTTDVMNRLMEALGEQLLELTPAEPIEDPGEWETICFDFTEKDNIAWKKLMTEQIKTAKTFEIHCWNDEVEELLLALQYGDIKNSDWKKGSIVEGTVTPEFVKMVIDTPKPKDIEIYNKMTPFFTIMFDNGFSSAHYGTENMVRQEKQ